MTKGFIAATLLLLGLPFAASAAPTGPYAVRMEVDPGLHYHTLFHPADLAHAGGAKLPVVVFAGGGCRNAGARFRNLLTELASQGYFIISLGEIGDPDYDADRAHEPRYDGRPTKTDVSQIDWAIEWARKEDARAGSPFAGRLDMSRLALMGQSCGGVQSLDAAARHPEARTLVVLNSGLFLDDRAMGGSAIKRADLGRIRTPTLILLGGKGDVAYANGEANFDLMTNAPAIVASADYGHVATYFDANGGLYGKVVARWLAWRLNGDRASAAMFVGAQCGLCTDRQWTVRRRGLTVAE